ncbi:MAG TPA: DUF4397 domain-containing protein [Puia sp.]|nr:DUF4397 domain-containing protein [Puia sp.]
MRTRKKQFYWGAAFFVILAAGWTGCAKTGSTYTTSPVTYVTVMNEAPYGPTTDIYLNSQLATGTGGIAAGAYSTKYGALQPGSYKIEFKKNGSPDSVLSTIAGGSLQLLDTLNFYTLIMYNDTNRAIQSMLIHDDFTSISTANANYRFFNLSPDAHNVDFYISGKSTGVSATYGQRTTGDNAIFTNYNSFISTAPNSYNFEIRNHYTDSVIASTTATNLVGGNVYTIFLTGTTNNFKINVLPASY